MDDLAAYLESPSGAVVSLPQACCMARIRRAHGRPLSLGAYEAIRVALAALEPIAVVVVDLR
jgi:hypothetical protein